MMNNFIIDNGAYLCKSGYSSENQPMQMHNFITKSKNGRETFIGSEIEECKDFSGIFYNLSFHKGMLVNFDSQKQCWNQLFKKKNIDFGSTTLFITEPIFNFSYIQECMEEIFFEEYGFEGLVRSNSSTFSAFKYLHDNAKEFCLVVDSGYSFTHIVPFFKGNIVLEGVRRINIGGKHLTNYLKEVVSYRQLMVMDETYVINQVKEELCFVSNDLEKDMKIANFKSLENTIVRDYVLPDYSNIRKGYAKSQEESTGRPINSEQLIRMNNERFTIPELIFYPSDIGIQETGLSEAIVDSIESCFKDIKPYLYSNIILIGGNVKLNGFKDRIFNEVRSMISDEYELNVKATEDPLVYAWLGGKMFANSSDCSDMIVNKKMFEEYGHSICKKKFNIY